MRAGNTNEAVQMLNLLLEFFENGARWTRGLYQDGHGRRCLIGASIISVASIVSPATPRCISFRRHCLIGRLG